MYNTCTYVPHLEPVYTTCITAAAGTRSLCQMGTLALTLLKLSLLPQGFARLLGAANDNTTTPERSIDTANSSQGKGVPGKGLLASFEMKSQLDNSSWYTTERKHLG